MLASSLIMSELLLKFLYFFLPLPVFSAYVLMIVLKLKSFSALITLDSQFIQLLFQLSVQILEASIRPAKRAIGVSLRYVPMTGETHGFITMFAFHRVDQDAIANIASEFLLQNRRAN